MVAKLTSRCLSRWNALSLPLLLLFCACAAAPRNADSALIVTGSATSREPVALPPQAVFEASVEDVSRADAPSTPIGRVRIDSPRLPTVVEPLRLQGHYTAMADAALFVECASGQRLPVAAEGDNAALQRAYSVARPRPGAAMLATVDGRVSTRPPLQAGDAPKAVLVVDRYVAIGAGPCGTPHSTAVLENTYWKLVTLHGQPVVVPEHQREPHFILQQPRQRVVGSAGCNRLTGDYRLSGEQLSFSRNITTRMACPEGMEQERAFLAALAATARWRIVAEQLDLMDAAGATLARLEAVYLY